MEYANGDVYDWQEEIFQKITSMKEMYLPDLTNIHQRVEAKYQHEEALPQQLRPDQSEKLKQLKTMLERMMRFLSVSKTDITPTLEDKIDYYERQIISFLDMHRPRVVALQPGQTIDNQMQDSAPRTQLTHPGVSALSASSMELGQGNGNGSDCQEDVFQKIKSMKEMYLPTLTEIHRRVEVKLQQQGSLPQQLGPDQFEKLKQFKTMLERMMRFLCFSKTDIMPTLKDKIDNYEKQIIGFLNMHRPRVVALQQSQAY